MRLTTLDCEMYSNIGNRLKACNIDDWKSQGNWLDHMKRMDMERISRLSRQYQPKKRSDIVRPRRRWKDRKYVEI
jgi:hypothetical protein